MSRVHWMVGVGALGVLVLLLMHVLGNRAELVTPARHVSLRPAGRGGLQASPTQPSSATGRPRKLKIAVGAIISPAKSLIFYEDIFHYIGEQLGREVEMVQRKTYAEVNFLMKEGRIDAAFVCSRPYVEGRRGSVMELLCVPVCFGKSMYRSYFIVHKDSGIGKLEDLRGKMFAFSDPLSNSGMLIPEYVLAKMGESPDTFFKGHIFTYSHDSSIRSVAENDVDGAAVDSLIWEYLNATEPEWTKQTTIIHRSLRCAIPPVVVSPDIDAELKENLRSAFLDMHIDPAGRRILKNVLIDRFTVIDDRAYDSIRDMEAFVKKFRSRK